MNKIKDVWELEHHIIAKKLHNVYKVKSADVYDNVKDLHSNEVLDTKKKSILLLTFVERLAQRRR